MCPEPSTLLWAEQVRPCPTATSQHKNLLLVKMAEKVGSVLFVWGDNAFGKLGVGDISADIKPTKLMHTFPSRVNSVAVSGARIRAHKRDALLP